MAFYTGVPDSLLKDFCGYVSDSVPAGRHVIAANEGAALAIAAGWQLSEGGVPVVYLQNSGLGNMINPLTSLVDPLVYSIPCLLVIGWRGEPGVPDEPQHIKQGSITPDMLRGLGIPTEVLPESPEAMKLAVADMLHFARQRSGPVALLVRKDTFEKYALRNISRNPYELKREVAIQAVLQAIPEQAAVVATTGMISREVYEARIAQGGLRADFLTVGCMGHASQIALGLCLARPSKQVVCLDGDGSLLMHLGSLAVIGGCAPGNFIHVVLNNGAHDSVGGQDTVGFLTDFPKMADAAGYASAHFVKRVEDVPAVFAGLSPKGPHFIEIRVARGARADLGRPKSSPIDNKVSFQTHFRLTCV